MERIGVRELRQHASRYLAMVERGESVEVTDRGRPVALLVPIPTDSWEAMIADGRVTPATVTGSLFDEPPLELDFSPSEILEAMRADER